MKAKYFVVILTLTVLTSCTERIVFEEIHTELQQVSAPTFDPPGGEYSESQQVTINCATEGAVIRYTTDGEEPTEESTVFTTAINVSEDTSIKAIAFKEGWEASQLAAANYTVSQDVPIVATPTFDPPGGLYPQSQQVTIDCATDGAVIRYTTTGEEPTEESTVFTTAIDVSEDTTIKARAFKEGWEASQLATAEYTVSQEIPTVATPTFDPPGGEYSESQQVTINCATDGAVIRYTTTGEEPTEESTVFTTAINVSEDTTIKARAFKEGWEASQLAAAIYTVSQEMPTVATPTFDPPGGLYPQSQQVTIDCATDGAVIRYTTTGEEPTEESTVFSTAIDVSEDTTIKARAFKEGWEASQLATAEYTVSQDVPIVATPTFDPPGGDYPGLQQVSINCATDGAVIRFTTNNSEPTESSPIYTNPLPVHTSLTLKAKGFKEGMANSQTATASYNILQTVATPTFNPPDGKYMASQRVTIYCTTNGAVIRYTLNGEEPTEESTVFTTDININEDTTIKARAFKDDWYPSQIATAEYTIGEVTPGEMVLVQGGSFSPDGGSYNVTLSSFYISNTEVTQSEWTSVMGGIYDPYWVDGYGQGPNYPAYRISWFDAIEYCNRLSIREGLTPVYSYFTSGTNPDNWPSGWNTDWGNHTNLSCNWDANGYRLPTEMEREFAARGGVPAQNAGTFNDRWAGTNHEYQLGNYAWYRANAGHGLPDFGTNPVGTKLPNELGLYDMTGNVWNYVWDRFGGYPTGSHNDPKGPSVGSYRVMRGGSWTNEGNDCRVDHRVNNYDTGRNSHNVGFRVSRNPN